MTETAPTELPSEITADPPPAPDVSAPATPAAKKAEQRAQAKALKDLMKPIAGRIAAARVLAVLSAVISIAPYVALVHIGDLLLRGEEGVETWIKILVSAFMTRLGLYLLALIITHFADLKLGDHIRRRLVSTLSRAPLSWFSSTNSGRVRKSLQDDVATIHYLIAHLPVDGTMAMVMPVALCVYAFYVDWRLGLLSLALIPLYLACMLYSMRGMTVKTVEMDKRLAKVSATMVEFVTGITVVKAFGRTGHAHRNYQDAADEFHTFYYDWVNPLMTPSAVGQSIIAAPAIMFVNLGGGAWLISRGDVSVADVVSCSLIALLIPYSFEVLSTSMWSQQLAGAASERVIAMLNTPGLPQAARVDGSATGITALAGDRDLEVVVDGVSYSYDDVLAVDNVSLTLRPGTVTALVGPSGSGKSTLATLIARFDDPDSGTITLGGVPLNEIDDLYSQVSFVLQDPQLLRMSLRDNIALGRPNATDEEIRAAARAAHILDEIEQLDDGLDTQWDGGNLSGGQAQRVAIARALLVDAPVLILDEATALADPESQAQIQAALTELVRHRTVLVIAHRPEVIAGADQILVMEGGHIVASGTHDELVDQPYYGKMSALR